MTTDRCKKTADKRQGVSDIFYGWSIKSELFILKEKEQGAAGRVDRYRQRTKKVLSAEGGSEET